MPWLYKVYKDRGPEFDGQAESISAAIERSDNHSASADAFTIEDDPLDEGVQRGRTRSFAQLVVSVWRAVGQIHLNKLK